MSSFIQKRLNLFEQIKKKRMMSSASSKPIQVKIIENNQSVKIVEGATKMTSAFEAFNSQVNGLQFVEVKYLD